MQVIVSSNVIQSVIGTPNEFKLSTLLGYACSGRHSILFDPPECIEDFLQKLSPDTSSHYQSAINFCIRETHGFASDVGTIRIDQESPISWADPVSVLPLDDALKVLAEKLGFLLEDGENDWHFLLGVMSRSQRESLLKAFNEGWIEPVHGGGTNIVTQLENRLKQPHRGLRTVMLFDSDRLHPDELSHNWSPRDIVGGPKRCGAYDWEILAKQKIPNRYWRLKRRFIESYMPLSELRIASDDAKVFAIEVLSRMSNEQRWFYNMKNGFKQDKPIEKRQLGLYNCLNEDEVNALMDGFGRDLAKHYAQSIVREFVWDQEARDEARTNVPRFLRLI
jgi:hypothetical protein